jgi:mRNA interferase RelE/StbE
MAYSIILTKSAIKELDDLPARQRGKIIEHLKEIEADPRVQGSQKLKGRTEYKLRLETIASYMGSTTRKKA